MRGDLDMSRTFERRYHASWVQAHGLSPLAKLGTWMVDHHAQVQAAPRDLVMAAAADVSRRLPMIAAREPTRRHQKHFAWLLGWHVRLATAMGAS
jgi:hypothetical protein